MSDVNQEPFASITSNKLKQDSFVRIKIWMEHILRASAHRKIKVMHGNVRAHMIFAEDREVINSMKPQLMFPDTSSYDILTRLQFYSNMN